MGVGLQFPAFSTLRTALLERCEAAGREEVLAHGGVEVLEGVEVLLLPVRKVVVEPLALLLGGAAGGGGREVPDRVGLCRYVVPTQSFWSLASAG